MSRMPAVTAALICALSVAACEQSASTQSGETAPVQQKAQNGIAQDVRRLVEENGFSGAILVADQTGILLKEGYGLAQIDDGRTNTPETKFVIASMTKSFTAALVLQLIEEGKLSLDDSIATLLPDFEAPYSNDVTVAHLLQNRSGIPHFIEIPGWFDNAFKQAQTDESFVQVIAALPLKFEPDADYLYSNVNYYLLGRIIDAVADAPYETELENRILAPLGLANTGQIYNTPQTERLAQNYMREDGALTPVPIVNPRLFRATASLYSTTDDLYRWMTALKDDTLLTEASKALLFDREKPMAWTVGAVPLSDSEDPAGIITYNGEVSGYTSIISYFPEHDGIVILLNNNNAGYETIATMTVVIAKRQFAQPAH